MKNHIAFVRNHIFFELEVRHLCRAILPAVFRLVANLCLLQVNKNFSLGGYIQKTRRFSNRCSFYHEPIKGGRVFCRHMQYR